jgi:hypothetical protein
MPFTYIFNDFSKEGLVGRGGSGDAHNAQTIAGGKTDSALGRREGYADKTGHP